MKTNRVSKEDLLKLWDVFASLDDRSLPIKFSYFIIKNKKLIKDEVDILAKLTEPTPEYNEYNNKRIELATRLADKDKHNNPIIERGNFVIIQNKKQFEEEVSKLRNEHKDAVDEFEKRLSEYNSMIGEMIEFQPYVISIDDLSNNLEPHILELLYDMNMIKEE